MRGLFVIGVAGGVGTTTIACGLAEALRARRFTVRPFKPVEVGCSLSDAPGPMAVDGELAELDGRAKQAYERLNTLMGPPPMSFSATVEEVGLKARDSVRLQGATAFEGPVEAINPYRFGPGVAPNVAAALADRPMVMETLMESLAALGGDDAVVVVDGGGSLMEPWGDGLSALELAVACAFPSLLVGSTERESVGHILMARATLLARGVDVLGVVLNRRQKRPSPEEAATPHALELAVEDVVLGVLPMLGQAYGEPGDVGKRLEVHVDLGRVVQCLTR